MNPEREVIRSVVIDIVQLRLDAFTGLMPGTTKADIIEAVGPVYAEGYGGRIIPLWTTVHEIDAPGRLTAWYELDEDSDQDDIGPDHHVAWIQRPIIPSDVTDLLKLTDSHQPALAGHLKAWPERGLCLWYSRRSRLPTLLFAFPSMSPSEFDDSPMATIG